ncbi:MAG: peptidoglycan recognition family protein [Phycisphaerales bacterium]
MSDALDRSSPNSQPKRGAAPTGAPRDRFADELIGRLGADWSRRGFLLAGMAFLAACNSPQQTAVLPEPEWPNNVEPPPFSPSPSPLPIPPRAETPVPLPSVPPMANVLPRSRWSHGAPDYADMNRMLPVASITVHHDALSPFTATDAASSEARIELIRVSHRHKNWADIGYHFVVDRAGRVYEARPVAWQGAHVKDRNEGNIGVLCLGNFEVQSPSEAQLNALVAHVKALRQRYRVATRNVYTHREWPGAQTLCPGASLQASMVRLRANKAFA